MDGIWHWVIVLLIAGLVFALIIRVIVSLLHENSPLQTITRDDFQDWRRPTEARLNELGDLKSKGLITEAEYERQRASILGNI